MDRIQSGETYRAWVLALNATPAGATGATLTADIRRDADGYWWDGTGFQSAHTTVTLTETDATNLPGFYHYDFNPNVTDFTCVIRVATATAAVVNDPWLISLAVGYWADDINLLSDLATAATLASLNARMGKVEADLRRALINTAELVKLNRRR